ncbi:hypothetical protein KL864_27155 [Mycolicibacterium goodii]|uniref:hypothetical protein n=1 Tax=Mycolicibacterium goodii TaxID=134601 RepID=UPI001BDD78E0|nr:hypothetical protein [Mycolicibacterium goodii]MBU8819569.1 hypothetical protein [Mycolicibacterium goodii]
MPTLTENEQDAITDARLLLESYGYVVLREKSYRQAQERQRVAEALRRAAEEDAERARQWALNCLEAERRLFERCTFLYGAAIAAGATPDDLRGHDGRVLDQLDVIDNEDTQEAE